MSKRITTEEVEQLKKLQKLHEETYQNMIEMGKSLTHLTMSSAWVQLKCQIGGAKAIFELIFEKIDES